MAPSIGVSSREESAGKELGEAGASGPGVRTGSLSVEMLSDLRQWEAPEGALESSSMVSFLVDVVLDPRVEGCCVGGS